MSKVRRRNSSRQDILSSSSDGGSSSESLGVEESDSDKGRHGDESNTLTVIQEQMNLEDIQSSNSFDNLSNDSLYSSDAHSSREINIRQSEEKKEEESAKNLKVKKNRNSDQKKQSKRMSTV